MKKYFYSLSLSLSLSLVFFLSSLNVYAQNKTTTADKFLEEMYNKELYDSAKIYGQNGIDAIYLITSRCADGDSNADEVAKKYCEAYKDYAFLDSNMVKHNFYNENDGYHDAKTSMIAEVNGAALFAPKTAAVVKTTNNEWIVVERNSNEVKAFFPAQIRTRKMFQIR